MNTSLPTRVLRERPDLDQLKRQARELLDGYRAADPAAVAEVNAHYRDADAASFALHDAHLVIARAYGFESWPKLRAHVDGMTVSRLCEATERGEIAVVRDVLARRPEIVNTEWPGHGEHRAIHLAVFRNDAAMVRLLMRRGADARRGMWPHRDASSAFTLASERGLDDIVTIIREEEARRTGTTEPEDEWPPLHRAAATLDLEGVRELIQQGATGNQQFQGWTPLDLAASGWAWRRQGSPERFRDVAKLLLEAGAELGAASAVALGHTEWILARHAEGALANPTVVDIFRPYAGLLSVAVTHNRGNMLELLLNLGMDPNERARLADAEEVQYTQGMPLYCCAGEDNLALAELLLNRGADPNAEICASGTPVSRAYGSGHKEMVALLERFGGVVPVSTAGYHRDTALARRFIERDPALADELLSSGASGGDPEIVRMALRNIDWPRDDSRWYWRLCDPLCFWNHMPGIPTGNPALDRGGYLECFLMILERADPNLRPQRFGQTVLHEVAAMGDHVGPDEVLPFAGALLDAGARLDIRDDLLKSTPLGWACRWGKAALVRLLLERGADPVEADAEPWATPLDWARKMGQDDVITALSRGLI